MLNTAFFIIVLSSSEVVDLPFSSGSLFILPKNVSIKSTLTSLPTISLVFRLTLTLSKMYSFMSLSMMLVFLEEIISLILSNKKPSLNLKIFFFLSNTDVSNSLDTFIVFLLYKTFFEIISYLLL